MQGWKVEETKSKWIDKHYPIIYPSLPWQIIHNDFEKNERLQFLRGTDYL
jgi:hypothetical protein